ncbi:MAG: FAD-dependent oxidoreductase [Clostridia bacterium]|nr:FAD-dependent oxidoreductase [Clostridia bacterium]
MKKEKIFRIALVCAIVFLTYWFGVKPILTKEVFIDSVKYNNEWARDELKHEDGVYDVIVVGDELEGIAAAVSASRIGARTLLISESKELGGSITKSLRLSLEPNISTQGELLNKGMFNELYHILGNRFTIDKYKNTIKKMVENEDNLEVVQGVQINSPIIKDKAIKGINVTISGKKLDYRGKRLIDATLDGKLLNMCNVPYYWGYEDLNLENSFLPVKLNFIVSGVDYAAVKNLMDKNKEAFYYRIKQYEPSNPDIRITSLTTADQGNGQVLIEGLEMSPVDLKDGQDIGQAYTAAVKESENFVAYLKSAFNEFKNAKLQKAAETLYTRGERHYLGEYILSANETLENTDFYDKVAMGTGIVRISVNGGEEYAVGRASQYGIPLGCIVPLEIENLLMVGGKISYSSLAASSADNLATNITIGESAGVVAVYSITKELTPRDIIKKKDIALMDELRKALRRQGVYLPEFKGENKNASNWSYSSLRQLNALGLVTGGLTNDYAFDREASQQDFAFLLLNGVYRISKEKYKFDLVSRLNLYSSKKDKLTKEAAAEILTAMHGLKLSGQKAYSTACERGYIDGAMKFRLKDKKVLTMDDVYSLTAYNLRLYTGKNIRN